MALCRITGTVYMPNGEPAAVRWVQFIMDVGERVEANYLGAVSPDPVRVRTDTNGNIDVSLITGNYWGVVESRGKTREYRFKAAVPEQASAEFSDLIAAADPVLPLPAWLQQALEARDEARAAVVDAEDQVVLAEQAALDAQEAALYSVNSATEFLSGNRNYPIGSVIAAKTGGEWIRVDNSAADFDITVSGDNYLVSISKGANVQHFGAKGDGATDDSGAFEKAVRAVLRIAGLPAAGSNRVIGPKIIIPATGRSYIIKQPRKFLPVTGTTRYVGLTYEGVGMAAIHFDYEGDDYMCYNDNQHLFVVMRGLYFSCNSDTSKFMYTTANGAAQDYTFESCSWNGVWQKLWVLRGVNNNSEYKWLASAITCEIRDVMLDIADSDQFLNYWFTNCKLWLYDGQCVRASAGGHFKFVSCDWSGIQGTRSMCTSTKGKYLIELTGRSHARGVCSLVIQGGRMECKENSDGDGINARAVYCEWNYGNIDIELDMSPVLLDVFDDEYSFVFDRGGNRGPIVSIHDSSILGKIKTISTAGAGQGRGVVSVINTTMCSLTNLYKPEQFVTIEYTANSPFSWPVKFDNCRGWAQSYFSTPASLRAWDVTIGALSAPSAQSFSVSRCRFMAYAGGNPIGGQKAYVYIPPGSLIVGVRMSNAGLGTVGTASTWRVVSEDTVEEVLLESSAGVQLNQRWVAGSISAPYLSTSGVISLQDVQSSALAQSSRGFVCEIEFISA